MSVLSPAPLDVVPDDVRRRAIVSPVSTAETIFALVGLTATFLNWPWNWFLDADLQKSTVDTPGTALFLLLFLAALALLTNYWHLVLRVARIEPLLPAFFALCLVSTLWAHDPGITLRRSVALALSGIFGIYLVVRFPFPKLLRLAAWAALVKVAADLAFVLALPSEGLTSNGLWEGTVSGKNLLGRDSVLAAMLMFWQVISRQAGRTVFVAGTGVAVLLLIQSRSTTAIITAILLVVLIPLYQSLRARSTLFGAVLVTLLGGSMLGVAISLNQLGAIAGIFGKDATLTGRTALWLDVLGRFPDRVLFGHGYESFWLGWWSPAHETWVATFDAPNAHNLMLDILLELGLVGALVFSGLVLRTLIRSIRFARSTTGASGLFPLGYLAYTVLSSSTERGVLDVNSLPWVLLIAVIAAVTASSSTLAAERE